MPKLKASEFTFDEDELDEAEYSESDFEDYGGEEPPAGAILSGYAKKVWLTTSEKSGADMLVVLFVAADNEGEMEEYNGWGSLDYQTLQTNTKFKWKPFIDAFGLTLRDIKNKMYTADEAETRGDVVEKIGTWVPGEDSDVAWARVVVKREKYNGEWRGKVGKWLPWDDAEEAEEPEPEPAKPARASRAAKPAAAKPAARSRRAAPAEEPEEEPEEPEDEEEEAEEEAPPARPTRAGRPTTRSAPSKPSATTGRGRRGGGSTEAPPF